MDSGYRFKTNNFGMCEVLSYGGCFDVTVRFDETGYTCKTSSDQIRKGRVKDRMAVTVAGVGRLGEKVDWNEKIYTVWVNMLKRCYDKSVQNAHPTYKGCSVCVEWHTYENFYNWVLSNDYQGKEIDKDKMVKGNKVYSPETCCFISSSENIQVAFRKRYSLKNANGSFVTIENLNLFCRENGLTISCMHRVRRGERKSHKGWVSVELIK